MAATRNPLTMEWRQSVLLTQAYGEISERGRWGRVDRFYTAPQKKQNPPKKEVLLEVTPM